MMIEQEEKQELEQENGNAEGGEGGEMVQYPQMIISNMPKRISKDEFEKFLGSKNIQYRKIKIVPNKTFTFVVFNTEGERDKAIHEINSTQMKYKNHDIYAGIRTENRRDKPNNNKRRNETSDESSENKKMKSMTTTNINDVVCPWWNIPYSEQLQKKEESMKQECLVKIKSKLRGSYFEANDNRRKNKQQMLKLPDWLEKNAPLIPLHPILASPETINNYRNKCEFTFGYAAEEASLSYVEEGNGVEVAEAEIEIGGGENDEAGAEVGAREEEGQANVNQHPEIDAPPVESLEVLPSNSLSTSPAKPSLGFRVSSFKDGLLVASPENCPHIPFPMVEIVKLFIQHIQGSELKVYDQYHHCGVWRLLTIRYSERTNQMILLLCVALKGVADNVWSQEKQKLVEMISQATIYPTRSCSVGTPPVVIKGFQLQVYDGISVPLADHPVETIFGEDHIIEQMNNCKFQVSPQAFFQVNTPVAEILYNKVVDELRGGIEHSQQEQSSLIVPTEPNEINESTATEPSSTASATTTTKAPSPLLCLDICCGTGTIGIICSKANLGSVVGIEMCPAAVENSKLNAQLNGLQLLSSDSPISSSSELNSTDVAAFICSRAETVLESILTDHRRSQDPLITRIQHLARGKKLLAVVDPPREGLHIDCLRAIRACTRIERLVYVSCNPTKSLIQDCIALCGPNTKRLTGTPFKPIYGTPVDLFPMTPHCELILVFERNSS